MLRTPFAAAVLTVSALMALTACTTPDRSRPFRDFRSGRYAAARAAYEHEIRSGGAEVTLDHNSAGTVALVQGDVEGAHRHFREAFDDLADLSATGAETIAATVGPERTKRWKGDPYERCMNAYYLGVTYWLLDDPDNAAASFKAGLLRDADSEEGAAQSDFALLWFLMGQAQREARHSDRGAQALATAHRLRPENPWTNPGGAADPNVLVLLELGLGPEKYPSGPHGSWVRFRERPYGEAYAEVLVGETSLGRTHTIEKLYHQAVTRGDKVLDHVNEGKAVFKDAAVLTGAYILGHSGSDHHDVAGVALLLAGVLAPAEADVRHWQILPGEVQVLTASLPPGEHDLTRDVKDASGRRLADVSKRVPVTVDEGRTTFVWVRAVGEPARPPAPKAGPTADAGP